MGREAPSIAKAMSPILARYTPDPMGKQGVQREKRGCRRQLLGKAWVVVVAMVREGRHALLGGACNGRL